MRFIHIADVHLGATPDSQMPWGEQRKKDIRDTFYELLDKIRVERIPLLLIAGDLFHRQPLKRELKELNARFSGMQDTQIVIVAGNHDYVHPKSCYRNFAWADNVHFLWKQEMQSVYLENLRTTIYGSSYWNSQEPEDIYSSCRPSDRPGYHILLLHGGDAKHRPFSTEKLKKAGFDYIACGHIHKAGHIIKNRMVMAGALEPTDSNDFGPHGYWLGEFSGNTLEMKFFPAAKCRYEIREAAVEGKNSMYEIGLQVQQILKDRPQGEISHIRLVGYRDPEIHIDVDALVKIERVASVVDETRPDYDLEKLKRQYKGQLIGNFIEQMQAYPDPEIGTKALYYGLDAIYEGME